MSVDNFIPSVWASSLLRAWDTALVYANAGVINRDYEGEVSAYGDSVRINMIGDVAVQTYAKNADISAPEALSDDQAILMINQQKYFNFQVDDVDAAQQHPHVMAEAMRRSAYGLRKTIDSFIAGLYTDTSASQINSTSTTYGGYNIGSTGSPITGTWTTTGSLAYDHLVHLAALLDSTDTPDDGTRFVVVPAWFEAYLRQDLRFVAGYTDVQGNRLVSGEIEAGRRSPGSQPNNGGGPGAQRIGQAAGLNVYKSNQVPVSGGIYRVIAGHPSAWSFVQQITKVEAYRPPYRFSDAVKGLVVYGAKVVRPYALAVLTCQSS